jgi:hypothetical protein
MEWAGLAQIIARHCNPPSTNITGEELAQPIPAGIVFQQMFMSCR